MGRRHFWFDTRREAKRKVRFNQHDEVTRSLPA
jgi:hypothetical protein